MMVTDEEVEKDVSSQPEERQVQNIEESPHSKVINEPFSKSWGTGVDKEEFSHLEDQNPLTIAVLNPIDHTQTGDKDIELPTRDCFLQDVCLVKPAAGGTANKASDSYIDSNANHIDDGYSRNDDQTNLDLQNQLDAITPNERFLEVKGEDETGDNLNNKVTGMELSNDVMAVHSAVGNGTEEEELKNKESRRDSTLNHEKERDISTDGVSAMDVLLENETKEEPNDGVLGMDLLPGNELKEELQKPELDVDQEVQTKPLKNSFLLESNGAVADETGTEEEQAAFMKELQTFHKERYLEFKPLKFYGEPLNCLKLWRAVIKLGGYEQVTSCKLWRQVGESFKPPKTCTTVSWTFRCFYEKALLEYEKHKMRSGELPFTDPSFSGPSSAGNQAGINQASGSGRARRDAAARAMQGWHSQRLLGNGEVGDPIIKDKNTFLMPKREKQLKSIGLLKRRNPSPVERAVKVARMKASNPQLDTMVVDVGSAADWVKINVQRTKDCFEVYALVPGLLREEVRVQSDPAGRLVISGQPEDIDNLWGVTPFKKVVSLPSRIDPHQTSAVVTLHGQLFVRVPFEQSDM